MNWTNFLYKLGDEIPSYEPRIEGVPIREYWKTHEIDYSKVLKIEPIRKNRGWLDFNHIPSGAKEVAVHGSLLLEFWHPNWNPVGHLESQGYTVTPYTQPTTGAAFYFIEKK